MRLVRNKKAVLSFFLVVVATFVFAYAYFKLGGTVGPVTKLVGNNEFVLVQQYEKGEAARLYLDLAAHNSKNKALYLFEQNGHFPDCGKNGLYFFWKNEDNTCYPTDHSISNGLSTVFIRLLNPYVKNYKKILLPEFSSADLAFNLAEKKLIAYPFNSINISSNPRYLINPGFSVNLNHDFDYKKIKEFIEGVNNECRNLQDLNVVGKTELSSCVAGYVDKFNKQNSQIRIEQDCGPDAQMDRFIEDYKLCAESLDRGCYCEIDLSFDKSGLNREDQALVSELNRKIQQENKQLIGKNANSPLKECRLNDRTFKFCASRNKSVLVGGRMQEIKTRFAAFIDDKSAPEPALVRSDEKLKKFKIVPSVSPDVSYYGVYIGKKDLPIDYSHYVGLDRAENIGETIYFDRNPDQYNIDVVAVDYNGNCMLQGQPSKC
ncbi:hypothetical protein GF371_00440 [Candidatus Woesearchaeota archaeon]|nr:hypothetical protein [Candidatus Woesearchaeota archaeon]